MKTLLLTFVAGLALSTATTATAATPAQLRAMVGPITTALQAHEMTLAANEPGKPRVACWAAYGSDLPIIQCVTYTMAPAANTQPMKLPAGIVYVSRTLEAFWAETCLPGSCGSQPLCMYRVGVGASVTSGSLMPLMNTCVKGWTKAIPS